MQEIFLDCGRKQAGFLMISLLCCKLISIFKNEGCFVEISENQIFGRGRIQTFWMSALEIPLPCRISATTPTVTMIAIQVATNMVTITPFLSSFLVMSSVVSTIESFLMSAEWVGVCANVDSGPAVQFYIQKQSKQLQLTTNSVREAVIHFLGHHDNNNLRSSTGYA
jgi:hypothetical protein